MFKKRLFDEQYQVVESFEKSNSQSSLQAFEAIPSSPFKRFRRDDPISSESLKVCSGYKPVFLQNIF